MSLPVDVTITGCYTMDNIEQALDVAEHFTPMSVEERKELLARTAAEARDGRHELYKTDTVFDATARNPQWLG
jgi:acyl-CoA reductase-like NAD-dependent aldehyde dehydrogenase